MDKKYGKYVFYDRQLNNINMKLNHPKILIGLFALLIPYTVAVLFLSDTHGNQVLFESHQPSEIHYGSFDPYILKVVEGSINWRTLGWPRSVIIKITRSQSNSYGHFIETNILIEKGDNISVNWMNNAIEIVFPLGQRLVIPKELFIGGR